MTKPFVPEEPEKIIMAEITLREAHMIKILREYSFGKILVHKANKRIVRVEPTNSQLINEDGGLSLAIS